jgi:hypothetical protein
VVPTNIGDSLALPGLFEVDLGEGFLDFDTFAIEVREGGLLGVALFREEEAEGGVLIVLVFGFGKFDCEGENPFKREHLESHPNGCIFV